MQTIVPPALGLTTAYFNVGGDAIRRENFLKFHEALGTHGRELVVVELAIGDRPFDLPERIPALRFRTTDRLWHKEALLNIGLRELCARGYEKLAWMDGDMIFRNPDWYERTCEALDRYDICQMFRTAVVDRGDGMTMTYDNRTDFGMIPGGAWAMKSNVFKHLPLYDRMITGSFDLVAWNAHRGTLEHIIRKHGLAGHDLKPLWDDVRPWSERWRAESANVTGYAENAVSFLPHGTMHRKKYFSRSKLLTGYDPRRDLRRRDDGILEWSPEASEDLKRRLTEYFEERIDEDTRSRSFPEYVGNVFWVTCARLKVSLRRILRLR